VPVCVYGVYGSVFDHASLHLSLPSLVDLIRSAHAIPRCDVGEAMGEEARRGEVMRCGLCDECSYGCHADMPVT